MATLVINRSTTGTRGVGEVSVSVDSTTTELTETNATTTTDDTSSANVSRRNDSQSPLHVSPLTSRDGQLTRFDWMRVCKIRLLGSFKTAFGMNARPALLDQKLRAEALVKSMMECWNTTAEMKPLYVMDGVGRFLCVLLMELDKLPEQHPLREVEINVVEWNLDCHLIQLDTFPDDIYCTHGNFWDYACINDNWVYGNFMGTNDKMMTRMEMFDILRRRAWNTVTMVSFSFRGEKKPHSFQEKLTSNGLRSRLKHSKDADLRLIFKVVSQRKTFVTLVRVHHKPSAA